MDVLNIYRSLYRYFGPQHWWPIQKLKAKSEKLKIHEKFEVCIGAILTQNTAWKNVEKVLGNLGAVGAMSPEAILRLKKEKLAFLIRPAGYYNQKTKKLKIFSKWFLRFGQNKYKLSELRSELLNLWGLGPETADSILLYAFDRPVFVIDTYTKRLCSLFDVEFTSYGEYQNFFQSRIPKNMKIYNEYHALIVAWGKMFGNKKTSAEARKIVDANHLCQVKTSF